MCDSNLILRVRISGSSNNNMSDMVQVIRLLVLLHYVDLAPSVEYSTHDAKSNRKGQ